MPIYKLEGSKDGRQRYRVRINITAPDGSYKQIERITYGKAEAKDLEQSLLREFRNSGGGNRHMTVSSLFEDYINARKREIKQSSLRKIISNMNNHILPSMGKVRLSKLTRPKLQEWKNYLRSKPLVCATCQGVYKNFNGMLNYAVLMGYIPSNQLSVLGNFREPDFTPIQEKIHYYTAEEFCRYISAAEDLCPTFSERRYYIFFVIAYFTGMRKGEIHALKWSDIEGNIIHVRRSINQKSKGGDEETIPKNKSSFRDINMSSQLAAVLAEHKREQQFTPQWSEDFRVCGGVRPLRDTTIANKNKKFALAANLPVLRIHDFRHSHASLLANEGINIQEVARRLGHSNVTITLKIYAHLYPREIDRAVAVLEKVPLPIHPRV